LRIPNPSVHRVRRRFVSAGVVKLEVSSIAGDSVGGAAARTIGDVLGLRGGLNKGIVEVRNTRAGGGVQLVPTTSGSSVTESLVAIERPAQIDGGIAFLVAEVVSWTIAHVRAAALSVRFAYCIQRKATRLKGRHPIRVPNPFVVPVPTGIEADA